jgi:hypothetical protein
MTKNRTVTFFRSTPFLAKAQGSDLQDFFAASKVSIGSYFAEQGSPRIASGLSFHEEKILLPKILDVPADHPEFRKKLGLFYAGLSVKVPYDGGVTLNISLEDDSKELSEDNLPVAILDYLKYRVCIKHPKMAASQEIAEGNSKYEFYVFDPVASSKRKEEKREIEDGAQQAYLEVKRDKNKVEQALILLGVNPHQEKNPVDKLKSLAVKDPKRFLEVINLKDFEVHALIQSLVDNKIVKVLMSKYFDVESDKLLANSKEEFVMFLQDDDQSDVIGTLKARLQDKQFK